MSDAKPARCPNPSCGRDSAYMVYQGRAEAPTAWRCVCADCNTSSGYFAAREAALEAWAKMGAWRTGKVETRIDYFFAPQQDDQATDWNDRCGYMIDRADDDVIAVMVVMELGTKWLARIVLSWDEDGETDEWDVLAFDSEAEAKAAVLANKPPKEEP